MIMSFQEELSHSRDIIQGLQSSIRDKDDELISLNTAEVDIYLSTIHFAVLFLNYMDCIFYRKKLLLLPDIAIFESKRE